MHICLKPDCIANNTAFTSPLFNDPNFIEEADKIIRSYEQPEIKDILPGHYSIDYIDTIFGRTYYLLDIIKKEACAAWDIIGDKV